MECLGDDMEDTDRMFLLGFTIGSFLAACLLVLVLLIF